MYDPYGNSILHTPNDSVLEIRRWAQDHELPYFDDRVHFPDFRIDGSTVTQASLMNSTWKASWRSQNAFCRVPPIETGNEGLVDLTGTDSNQIVVWLRRLQELRTAGVEAMK